MLQTYAGMFFNAGEIILHAGNFVTIYKARYLSRMQHKSLLCFPSSCVVSPLPALCFQPDILSDSDDILSDSELSGLQVDVRSA